MSGRGTKSSPEVVDRGTTELRDGIAFGLLPGIGGAALRQAIERFGSAADALRAHGSDDERRGARLGADEILTRATGAGAGILLLGEPAYPSSLLDLPSPPNLLFTLGDARWLRGPCVGIVGTRHSSSSGDRIAYQIASTLARAGAVVVSGMAFGIDGASHRGALDARGGTVAVLGGGADVPYPPAHASLHERITRLGVIVSEIPLGVRPGRGAFPRRNRIIAALAETLVVIEAGERSGALITARIALDLGRQVAVVPGPIDSPRHIGSNRLLADGASVITRVDDVLSIAGIEAPGRAGAHPVADGDSPDPSCDTILEALRTGASDVEGIGRSTRLSPRDLVSALSALELAGRIQVSPTGAVRSL